STFKILNSLIALESKVIENEKEFFQWDGVERKAMGVPVPAWNQDNNLEMAYKNSTVWFYMELAKKIGRETYKKVFQKIGYGNDRLAEKGDDFWNYGAFG